MQNEYTQPDARPTIRPAAVVFHASGRRIATVKETAVVRGRYLQIHESL